MASPGEWQACPNSAACWSPAMPAIGSVDAREPRLGAHAGRRHHLGQHRARDVEQGQQVVVPAAGVDVEEHRAARVGRVGDVGGARRSGSRSARSRWCRRRARRAPRARAHPARCRAATRAWCRRSTRRRRGRSCAAIVARMPGCAQLVAEGRRAAVLPDDGVGERAPGRALPEHRGLALVGDADGRDVGGADPGLGQALRAGRPTGSPRSRSRRARPSPAAGRSAGTPAARRRGRCRRGRRPSLANWSCPGRGRGCKPSGCLRSLG